MSRRTFEEDEEYDDLDVADLLEAFDTCKKQPDGSVETSALVHMLQVDVAAFQFAKKLEKMKKPRFTRGEFEKVVNGYEILLSAAEAKAQNRKRVESTLRLRSTSAEEGAKSAEGSKSARDILAQIKSPKRAAKTKEEEDDELFEDIEISPAEPKTEKSLVEPLNEEKDGAQGAGKDETNKKGTGFLNSLSDFFTIKRPTPRAADLLFPPSRGESPTAKATTERKAEDIASVKQTVPEVKAQAKPQESLDSTLALSLSSNYGSASALSDIDAAEKNNVEPKKATPVPGSQALSRFQAARDRLRLSRSLARGGPTEPPSPVVYKDAQSRLLVDSPNEQPIDSSVTETSTNGPVEARGDTGSKKQTSTVSKLWATLSPSRPKRENSGLKTSKHDQEERSDDELGLSSAPTSPTANSSPTKSNSVKKALSMWGGASATRRKSSFSPGRPSDAPEQAKMSESPLTPSYSQPTMTSTFEETQPMSTEGLPPRGDSKLLGKAGPDSWKDVNVKIDTSVSSTKTTTQIMSPNVNGALNYALLDISHASGQDRPELGRMLKAVHRQSVTRLSSQRKNQVLIEEDMETWGKGLGGMMGWVRMHVVLYARTKEIRIYTQSVQSAWGTIPIHEKGAIEVRLLDKIECPTDAKWQGRRFDLICKTLSDQSKYPGLGIPFGQEYRVTQTKRFKFKAKSANSRLMWVTLLQSMLDQSPMSKQQNQDQNFTMSLSNTSASE